MKILYIIHTCKMDGSTISFLNLVKGMLKAGHEVVIVHPYCPEKDRLFYSKLENITVKCHEAHVALSYNREGRIFLVTLLRPFFIMLSG